MVTHKLSFLLFVFIFIKIHLLVHDIDGSYESEQRCFSNFVSSLTSQGVNQSVCNCTKKCQQSSYGYAVSNNSTCHCINNIDSLKECSCSKDLNCSLVVYNTSACKLSYFEIKSSALEFGKNVSVFNTFSNTCACAQFEYEHINFTVGKRSLYFSKNLLQKNIFEFVINTQHENSGFNLCLSAFGLLSKINECWDIHFYPQPIISFKIVNATELKNGSMAVRTNSCVTLSFTVSGNFSYLFFNISNGFSKEVALHFTSHRCQIVVGKLLFSQPGVYSMTIILYNSDRSYNYLQNSHNVIIVQDEIQFVCLETTYAFLGIVSLFRAKIYGSYSDVTYQWYFREENKTVFTDTPECYYNVSYDRTFLFPVQLTAQNLVSNNTTEYDVIIIPYITEVIITPKDNPVLEEDHVNFSVSIKKPKTLWDPKLTYLWTFQIDSHLNTHISNLQDFRAPSSGIMHVTLSVTSNLLTINGSCQIYVIKRIKPFPVYCKPFRFGEITSFFGSFNVSEYDVSYFDIKYNPKVLWMFGDTQQLASYDISVQHMYNRTGIFFAYVNVSNILSSYTSNITVYVLNELCALEIYFSLEWDTVKDIQLYENIVFYPRVKVLCPKATNMEFLWQFESAELKEDVNILKYIEPTLNIPAKALGVGMWKFHFTVNLNVQNVYKSYTNTLRINRGGLKAIIKNNGVRVINFNLQRKIVLNFNDSFDQDAPNEVADIKYSWECYTEKYTNCFKSGYAPPVNQNESLLTFMPNQLEESSKKFLFVLIVEKDGLQPAESSILFKVDTRIKFQTAISCDTCKQNGFSPFAKMKFHVVCPECENKQVTYFWEIKFRFESTPLLTYYRKCMPSTWPAALLRTQIGVQLIVDKTTALDQITYSQCVNFIPTFESNLNCSQMKFNNFACTKTNRPNNFYSMKKMYKNLLTNKDAIFSQDVSNLTMTSTMWSKENNTNVSIITQKKKFRPVKYLELKAERDLTQYFIDKPNYYSRVISPGDYVYSNNKDTFLIQANSLFPGQNYEISVNIFNGTRRDSILATSVLYFKTEEPPVKGSCVLIGNETGVELETEYSIKCEKWKSNHTLSYTLTAENNEIIIHSSVFMFDFILSVDFAKNQNQANLTVTIEDDEGRWISLCPLSVTVLRNDKTTYHHIFSKLRELENKQLVVDSNLELQKITVLLHKCNRLLLIKLASEDVYRIKEKACKLIPRYIIHTPVRMVLRAFNLILENAAELSMNCTYWMLLTLNEIVSRSRQPKQLFRQAKFQTYVTDSNKVFASLLNLLKNDSTDQFKLGYKYHKSLMKLVMQEYFINETLTLQSDPSLAVFAHKGFQTKWTLQPGVRLDFKTTGCIYLTITLFNRSFYWLDQNSVYLVDVFMDHINHTAQPYQPYSTRYVFDLSFPVKEIKGNTYTLQWDKVNLHKFSCNDDGVGKYHLMIEIKELSANYRNFQIQLVVRYNTNKRNITWIIENYFKNFKHVSSFSPNDVEFTSSFEVALKIVPTNQRIIQKYKQELNFVKNPWINYTISVKSLFCKQWHPQSFTLLKDCHVADASTSAELLCRCRGDGLVTGYMKNLHQKYSLFSPVKRNAKSFIVIEGMAILLAIFATLMIYSWYSYKDFPSKNIIIELPDNLSCDKYKYYIAVETGHSYGSGTTSKICAVLYGENGCSQKFELTCENKPFMFQRSSTDILLLRCPKDLGKITHLLLWHNNQGNSADWYLKQVIIKSSTDIYYFSFYNWLSLSRGIHKTYCNLIATSTCCTSRIQLFLESYVDYNIWLSVFFGPIISQFSLTKRFGYLLSKVLFFTAGAIVLFKEEIEKNKNIFGLLHILSPTVLTTPALLVLIYVPISMVLTYFFRYSPKSSREKRSLGLKFNKVGDVYMKPNSETTKMRKDSSGFLSDGQLSFYSSLTNLEEKKYNDKWHFNFSFYFNYASSCVLALIIALWLGIVLWKSLFREENNGLELSWMQFTFLTVLWDVLVICPLLSSVKAFIVSLSSFTEYYEQLFQTSFTEYHEQLFQTSCSTESKGSFEQLSNNLLVRHRARFIRYAEPDRSKEIKLLYSQAMKQKLTQNYLRTLITSIALFIVAIILATSVDISQSYNFNERVRKIVKIGNVSTVNDFWKWSHESFSPVLRNKTLLFKYKELMVEPTSLIGPVKLYEENSSYIIQSDHIPLMLYSLQSDGFFNSSSFVSINFNLRSNFQKNLVFSKVQILFMKKKKNRLSQKLNVESFSFEKEFNISKASTKQFFVQVMNSTRRLHESVHKELGIELGVLNFLPVLPDFLQEYFHVSNYSILLSLISFWFFIMLYLNVLEKGLIVLFKVYTVFKLCVATCGVFVCGIWLVQFVFIYSMQTTLDMVDYSSDFLDLSSFIILKKVEHFFKGLLVFLSSIYLALSISASGGSPTLLRVLKSGVKDVMSYMIVFVVLVGMSSHVINVINQTPFVTSYEYTLKSIVCTLRITKKYLNDRRDGNLYVGTLFGVVILLFIKTSCVFFIGKVRSKKKKKVLNIIPLCFLLFNSWTYYWKRVRQLFYRKMKNANDWSIHAPQDCIYKEINHQLEEILYRINCLAESDLESSDEIDFENNIDSEPNTKSEYLDEVLKKGIDKDKCKNAPNSSVYFNALCDSHFDNVLISGEIVKFVDKSTVTKIGSSQFKEQNIANSSSIHVNNPLSQKKFDNPDSDIFKRFLLSSIDEKKDHKVVQKEKKCSETFSRFLLSNTEGWDSTYHTDISKTTDKLFTDVKKPSVEINDLRKDILVNGQPKDCLLFDENLINGPLNLSNCFSSEKYLSKNSCSFGVGFEDQKQNKIVKKAWSHVENGKNESSRFKRFLLHKTHYVSNSELAPDDIRQTLNSFSSTKKSLSKEEVLLRLKDLEEEVFQTNDKQNTQEYIKAWMSSTGPMLDNKNAYGNLDSGLGSV